VAEVINKGPVTLTDKLRRRFQNVLQPIAGFLNRLGILPNTMTILGLLGNTVGAVFLSQGYITMAGFIFLLMGPMDALDGAMARLRGESSVYGAFLDSVTDRYSELVIYGGLLIHFASQEQWLASVATYIAAAGSVLVSYTRARAQSLGFEAKVGAFTRVERFVVLVPLLIFNLPVFAVAILAFGTNLTALQRIVHVRKAVERVN
jgi:CDP-diacylglycerol--glycerol-3-phosphate 3-phosphatidyltransferase